MSLDKDHWVTRETLLVIFDTALQPEALPTDSKSSKGNDRGWERRLPSVKAELPQGCLLALRHFLIGSLPFSTARELKKKKKKVKV